MSPGIAAIIFTVGIAGLFWLDRDAESRASKALWIPVFWLLINGSRPVSEWLADFGIYKSAVPVNRAESYLDGTPIDRNVYLVLLAIGLIILISRGKQIGSILLRNAPILIFFAYCAISIAWSDYSFVSFKRWTKGVGDIVMVLIILTDPQPRAALKRLFSRLTFILVPLSVLFIKYYPELGREYNIWSWRPSFSGVTTQKNLLGMLCLVLGIGTVWQILTTLRQTRNWKWTRQLTAHFAILAMIFWLFGVANSMTSLACFLVAAGLVVVLSLGNLRKWPVVVHVFVAVAIAVPMIVLFSGLGGSVVESLGRDPTLTGRTGIWDAVLAVSGNPFLGTGYESFWLGDRLIRVWNMTVDGLQEAHNGYLELYLNLGWIGISLLAGLIVAGYRNVVVALKNDQFSAILRLGLLVAAIIYSFTEAGFRETTLTWVFFLLAIAYVPQPATAESLAEVKKEDRSPEFLAFQQFAVRPTPIANYVSETKHI
jgi:exopolysaccharide production protein ExoQ